MCGSGTFLIEGAWMSMRRAPGLERTFAFERFPAFDTAAWEERRARAKAEALPAPRSPLHGFDINAGALGTARRNARRAGLTLALERRDVKTLQPPVPGPGLVVANPPYGKRVGEGGELPELYRALGATLRQVLPGLARGADRPRGGRADPRPGPARHPTACASGTAACAAGSCCPGLLAP